VENGSQHRTNQRSNYQQATKVASQAIIVVRPSYVRALIHHEKRVCCNHARPDLTFWGTLFAVNLGYQIFYCAVVRRYQDFNPSM
jgi:hypothetical protein